MDPYQVNFFITAINMPSRVKRKSPTGVDQLAEELSDLSATAAAGNDDELIEVPIEAHNLSQYHQKREDFNLAEALLNLSKSPDQKIAVKACEGN